MKNTLYNYIQEQSANPPTFDDIFNHFYANHKELTKQSLSAFLRELENDGLTAEINKKLIDLTQLPEIEGNIHWNLNQLCWIEDSDKTNEFGISFNTDENLTTVINKKKAFYGSRVKGRVMETEDRKSFYITETISQKEVLVFASLRKDFHSWNMLNSSSGFRFKFSETDANTELKDSDVCLFKTNGQAYSLVEKIGNIADKGIESRVIKALAKIEDTPDNSQEYNVKPLPLIDKQFITIDSLGTKDIDDAIYIEKTKSGYELYVAIADVSSYVKPDDIQDQYAQDKCTSFYFYNNTVHMLSRTLAENYCSLNPGAARLSMVCHMSYDLQGNLLGYNFSNNEIKSHARLTYQDVDAILADTNPQESLVYKNGFVTKWTDKDEPGTQWVTSSLKTFEEFSSLLSTEYKPDYWFVPSADLWIGEDGKVEHLYIDNREGTKSQKIVETSMLAANKVAAQFLFENFPHLGLFRNQTAPKEEFERPKAAFYHADNEGHWGLKTEYYTHFTSPIRRYCDLITHRLIKDVLAKNKSVYNKDDVSTIVERINYQQYVAKQCSMREKNLLTGQYLQKLVGNKEMQVKFKIVDFNDNGIVIRNNQLIENYIPKYKVDKKIVGILENLKIDVLDPTEKEKVISELNNSWKVKCFIDNYHWLDDRKEATYKFYIRDFSEDLDQEKKSNVKI
jgi:exoribonuclease R